MLNFLKIFINDLSFGLLYNNIQKRVKYDISTLLLILSNFFVILGYYFNDLEIINVLLIYFVQCFIIGFFNMISISRISFEDNKKADEISIIAWPMVFFLFLTMALFSTLASINDAFRTSLDFNNIGLYSLSFLVTYIARFRVLKELKLSYKSFNLYMALPFVKLLPLIVLIYFTSLAQSGILLVFLFAKLVVDAFLNKL